MTRENVLNDFETWLNDQHLVLNDFGNKSIKVPFWKEREDHKCAFCKKKEAIGGFGWLGFTFSHCGGECEVVGRALHEIYIKVMSLKGVTYKNIKGGNMPKQNTNKQAVEAPKKVAGLKAFEDDGFETPLVQKKELKPLQEKEAQSFTQIMNTKGLKVERLDFQNKVKKSITIDPILWNVYDKRAKQDGGAVSKIIEKALLEALDIPNLQALYLKAKSK